MLLKEAINAFVLQERQRNLREKTILQKAEILSKLPVLKIDELNLNTLLVLGKQWNHLSSSTQKTYWSTLRSFLKFLDMEMLSKHIPHVKREYRLPKEIPVQPILFSMLEACPESSCKTAVYMLYSTGIRIGELLHLQVHHVDLSQKELLITHTKNRHERKVPIPETMIERLNQHEPNSRFLFDLSYERLWDYIRTYLNTNPHSLRHYYAVHMLENGVSLCHLSELLGHRSIKSTMIYARYVNDQLHKNYKAFHPRSNQ